MTSALFTLVHRTSASYYPLYFGSSVSLDLIYWRSGSLNAAILVHAVSNGILCASPILSFLLD